MLQGNPFETQLVVQERTTSVRQDVRNQHGTLTSTWLRKVHGWWQARRTDPELPQSSLRSLKPLEDQR